MWCHCPRGKQVWQPLPQRCCGSGPGEGCARATKSQSTFTPFSASAGAALQPDGSRCQPVPLPRETVPWGFSALAKPAGGYPGWSMTS